MLDVDGDPFPNHPILPAWREALASTRPDASDAELDIDTNESDAIECRVLELVAELGGIPAADASVSTADPSSD